MSGRIHRSAAVVLGCWLACASLAGDVIRPHNTTTAELGVLVDGEKGGVAVNDERYVHIQTSGFFAALFPVIPVDNFTPQIHNEVIGFAHGRPPILVPNIGWTAGNNTIDVEFDDEYLIDVFVWIVDPTEDLPLDVAEHGVEVSRIWSDERQGLAFDKFQITNASDDPDAAQFLDFNCGMAASIKSLIGHNPDGVNVYYVDTVDFGSGPGMGSGVWCGEIIAMGRLTSGGLLAHELGHAFHLSHTNGASAFFDTTNVMHNASSNRKYFTEGQTFRAVYHGSSAINNVYDVRSGAPTRNCGHHYSETDNPCPSVQNRIWADGASWPPN